MSRHRGWILLVLLSGLLFLPWIGARDLWNPNEPTYGRAVVEMAERGAWLLPTVNGETFDEKPILYFWLARVAGNVLGGVDELTLRLPSALAGILAVVLVYLLVYPYVGRRRATIAGVVLATTFIVFWSARTAQMDLLLATTTLAAIVCAVRVIDFDLDPRWGWCWAGAAAGIGVLAKGPVGLLVPGLVVLVYLAASHRLAEALKPALIAGIASFSVIALPWFVLLWVREESEFLMEMLWRQNFRRFVAPWDHQAAWWYYLVNFWIDMAPWSLFIPLAVGLKPADEQERKLHRLAWSWVVVVIIFFSLSASKRSPYILPIAPAVAVLVSALAIRGLAGRLGTLRTRAALVIHGLLAAGFVAIAVHLFSDSGWLDHAQAELASAARVIGVAALVGGLLIAGGVVLSRLRRFSAPVALTIAVAAFYLVAAGRALPAANGLKSHRPFSESVLRHVGPKDSLRGFHHWRWRAGYSFYTGRSIPNLDSVEQLRAYWSSPETVYLIVERGKLTEARQVLGSIRPLEDRAIGGNHAYLFANRSSIDP